MGVFPRKKDTVSHDSQGVVYRDFRSDINDLDGKPISEVTGDLASVALILKKEGFISVRLENEKIIYRKTSKADRTIEAMI